MPISELMQLSGAAVTVYTGLVEQLHGSIKLGSVIPLQTILFYEVNQV
jgi:hypothetical protein